MTPPYVEAAAELVPGGGRAARYTRRTARPSGGLKSSASVVREEFLALDPGKRKGMNVREGESVSYRNERIVRDLELFAHRLEQAHASAEPEVWRTLREELQRITERIVTSYR